MKKTIAERREAAEKRIERRDELLGDIVASPDFATATIGKAVVALWLEGKPTSKEDVSAYLLALSDKSETNAELPAKMAEGALSVIDNLKVSEI